MKQMEQLKIPFPNFNYDESFFDSDAPPNRKRRKARRIARDSQKLPSECAGGSPSGLLPPNIKYINPLELEVYSENKTL